MGRLLRTFLVILASGLVGVGFLNCSKTGGTAGSAQSTLGSGQLSGSGNGEGYGGMVAKYGYSNPTSPCSATNGQGIPLPNKEIDLYSDGSYLLSRNNCLAVNPPTLVPKTEISILSVTAIVYQGSIFIEFQ